MIKDLTEKEYQKALFEIARDEYSFYLEFVNKGYTLAKHHLLICNALEAIDRNELNKLMIFLPPRHSKSSSVSETFPSWYLGRNPNRKVILASYGDALAKKFGRANRQKVEEYGRELFDIQIAKDNGSVQNWGLQNSQGQAYDGYMISYGLGSSITGFGCSLLLIDDPIKSRQQAESQVQRDYIWNEYQSTLLTRLERKTGSAQILIQTRWHDDDLAARLLNSENSSDWHVICLPAEAEQNDPLGREMGQPLWPEMGFDENWIIETKKAVGSRAWNSLYQQRPTDIEGGLFRRKWFNYYREAPGDLEEIIISVDTTFKDIKTADYCVFQVWGKKGANKYLLDQVRDRMDLPTTMATLEQVSNKWPRAAAKYIEDKANGTAVIQMLKHKISGLIPVNPTESKTARAFSVTPTIEAGNVYLPEGAPWLHDFLAEVTGFPNYTNDDQVDAMVQALSKLEENTGIFIGRA